MFCCVLQLLESIIALKQYWRLSLWKILFYYQKDKRYCVLSQVEHQTEKWGEKNQYIAHININISFQWSFSKLAYSIYSPFFSWETARIARLYVQHLNHISNESVAVHISGSSSYRPAAMPWLFFTPVL